MLHADVAGLVDRVISRATDLAGPSFQSCGEITIDAGEDCFLYSYRHKLAAIGFFSVNGKEHQAAEARVLTRDGALITVSAYSDRPGLTEVRCAEPFIATEFAKQRVRCKDKYQPPLGAKTLKSRPVWLTTKEEHPVALEHPSIPDSVCRSLAADSKAIAQLLVDDRGNVPEVQMIIVPAGCSGKDIESVLKRWRYSPPKKDDKPIATVVVIEISFKK
jgi:hypothetical protein